MRIVRISLENFRGFREFQTEFDGGSRLLIGENAIGKTSLMSAMARALGRERTFHRNDFQDLDRAIDIRLVLGDLSQSQLGVFCEAVDFGSPSTLTVGVQAVWDHRTEECEVTHGYPTKAWRKSSLPEREAIEVDWIPNTRDASRLLQLGARRGFLAELLEQADLGEPIAAAIAGIQSACDYLATSEALAGILEQAGKQLSAFVPVTSTKPYEVESIASTDLGVLRQLQLALEHVGPRLPLSNQSSGMAQLSLFAFCLMLVAQRPGSILLIDEPENSLHAQCQRAFLRALQRLPNQFILSTHSASLLDRADPREVVRLYRDGEAIRGARPHELTDSEAQDLRRYMTAQNAEGFFARKVILVEGISDLYAIDALAERTGKSRDAAGVSIVVMAGAGSIGAYLSLLGPRGLRVELAGLCDVSDEVRWKDALRANGLGDNLNREGMTGLGFHVCDRDLEDVLITAVGTTNTLRVLEQHGDLSAFTAFAQQPAHRNQPLHDQLHDFIHGRNVTYATLLVDALDLAHVPPALNGVLGEI